MTRIAVMSFAHPHAVSYLQVLSRLPGVEVLASDPGHSGRPAGESGGPALAAELGVRYVDGYDELLAWRPDGVVVCAETSVHPELVGRAAAAGAHVLCEKPLATSLVDARAMIDSCAAFGVFLMVAYPVRFSPAFSSLREMVSAGALGQVLAVTGTNNGRLPVDSRAWFGDSELSGGGAVMDHIVHLADLLDCLSGGVPATSVYAVTNRVVHAGRVAVETGGLLSVSYAVGLISPFHCSWSRPDSYPTWGGCSLQLVGSEGIADLGAFGSRVEGHSNTRGALWLPYGPDLDQLLLEEFLDAVRTGRAGQPDGAVGYRTLEIALAGYRSVLSGQPVVLPTSEEAGPGVHGRRQWN